MTLRERQFSRCILPRIVSGVGLPILKLEDYSNCCLLCDADKCMVRNLFTYETTNINSSTTRLYTVCHVSQNAPLPWASTGFLRGIFKCATAPPDDGCHRSYTTIENPSYFLMTLSCTEAIQSFISHYNQYSLVDPSWGNIPCWVWQGG